MDIKNKNYRQFIEKGLMKTIDIDDIEKAINNIDGKDVTAKKAFIIMMYYTGARPIEILNLKAGDIKKVKNNIEIFMQGSKRGMPRPIIIPIARKYMTFLYKYAYSFPENVYIFFQLWSNSYKMQNGKKVRNITNKVHYFFNKAFENVIEGSIPPYYLRHNRFTKVIIEGGDVQDIKHLKGAKTLASAEPYIHLSTKKAKKIGRMIK